MAVGDVGEQAFIKAYSNLGPVKSKDRAFDFHLKDGKTVELKSDSYAMEDTENFFMEISAHGGLGGPYRALNDNVDFFIYYFLKNKTFFWFDTKKLCAKLDELILTKKYKIKSIRSTSWVVEGYTIPRSDLECVLQRKDVFS